jgi:LysM repeat protein
MHLPRFRPVFALLPLLTLGAVNAFAIDPDAKATPPAPAASAAETTPAPVAPSSDASDTEAKLAGALRSFTLVQNENDDLKAQVDKLTAAKAALEDQVASLKTAVPIAAQAQALREQLRQTQEQLASLAAENARLRTAFALAGPAPGALPAPEPTRMAAPAPTAAPAETTAGPAAVRTYTVVAGDTLTRISQKYYGTPGKWQDILAANRDTLKSEKSLAVGQTIRIP